MHHIKQHIAPDQLQNPSLLESSNTVKITLIEAETRMQMAFYIDKQCHIRTALRVFADHAGHSTNEYYMSFKELRVDGADTATSVSSVPIVYGAVTDSSHCS